jgi:hypothetical protein
MDSKAEELYTVKTIATLGGASLAVVAVSAALGSALNFNPRWFALLFAEILSFAIALQLPKTVRKNMLLFIVAFINGALIYCQAVGIKSINDAYPSHGNASNAGLITLPNDRPWFPSADLEQQARATAEEASATRNELAASDHELYSLRSSVTSAKEAIAKANHDLLSLSDRAKKQDEALVACRQLLEREPQGTTIAQRNWFSQLRTVISVPPSGPEADIALASVGQANQLLGTMQDTRPIASMAAATAAPVQPWWPWWTWLLVTIVALFLVSIAVRRTSPERAVGGNVKSVSGATDKPNVLR